MEGQAAYDSHLSRGCESSVVASVRSLSWPRTVLDSRAGPLIWSRLTKVFGSCEEAMCSHSVEFQSGCTHIHTYTHIHIYVYTHERAHARMQTKKNKARQFWDN